MRLQGIVRQCERREEETDGQTRPIQLMLRSTLHVAIIYSGKLTLLLFRSSAKSGVCLEWGKSMVADVRLLGRPR